MSTITNLAASLRPIAVSELRPELRSMRSNEALLVHLDGRAFVIIDASAWADLVDSAGDRSPLVPEEF
jgi:hypothetical protein